MVCYNLLPQLLSASALLLWKTQNSMCDLGCNFGFTQLCHMDSVCSNVLQRDTSVNEVGSELRALVLEVHVQGVNIAATPGRLHGGTEQTYS